MPSASDPLDKNTKLWARGNPKLRNVEITGGELRNMESISTDAISVPGGRPGATPALFQDVTARDYLFSDDSNVYTTKNISLDVAKQGGISDPGFNIVGGGIRAYQFANNKDEELFLTFQMPNNYREGATVLKSVTWIADGATTGVIRWGLECFWTNTGEATTTPATLYINAVAPGVDQEVVRSSFPNISGTGKEKGSVFVCRLFRHATSGTDTYVGAPWGVETCIHFMIDAVGGASCE